MLLQSSVLYLKGFRNAVYAENTVNTASSVLESAVCMKKSPRASGSGACSCLGQDPYFFLAAFFLVAFCLAALRGVSKAAWAAAKRAIGTRKGLQLT